MTLHFQELKQTFISKLQHKINKQAYDTLSLLIIAFRLNSGHVLINFFFKTNAIKMTGDLLT